MTESISVVDVGRWENGAGKMANPMKKLADNGYVHYLDCGDDFIGI